MIGKLLDQVGPILIAVVVLGLIGTAIGVATNYSNKQKEGIESTLNAEEYRDYTDLDGRDDIKCKGYKDRPCTSNAEIRKAS